MSQLENASSPSTYRNFNLCPHCIFQGKESLLCRMCEGVPMISRSDGLSFHLLLADGPLPYPVEIDSGPTKLNSICFWYSHVKNGSATLTSVVVFQGNESEYAAFFRTIEHVADLLAEKLRSFSKLANLYKFEDGKLLEAMF